MDIEKCTYRVWEYGLKGSTYEDIKAPTAFKAKEIYAKKWAISISNLDAEEIVPAQ